MASPSIALEPLTKRIPKGRRKGQESVTLYRQTAAAQTSTDIENLLDCLSGLVAAPARPPPLSLSVSPSLSVSRQQGDTDKNPAPLCAWVSYGVTEAKLDIMTSISIRISYRWPTRAIAKDRKNIKLTRRSPISSQDLNSLRRKEGRCKPVELAVAKSNRRHQNPTSTYRTWDA